MATKDKKSLIINTMQMINDTQLTLCPGERGICYSKKTNLGEFAVGPTLKSHHNVSIILARSLHPV
jgi:hypothetical protein